MGKTIVESPALVPVGTRHQKNRSINREKTPCSPSLEVVNMVFFAKAFIQPLLDKVLDFQGSSLPPCK
jgi:hypothetical protein